jgi:hypothetical protein
LPGKDSFISNQINIYYVHNRHSKTNGNF